MVEDWEGDVSQVEVLVHLPGSQEWVGGHAGALVLSAHLTSGSGLRFPLSHTDPVPHRPIYQFPLGFLVPAVRQCWRPPEYKRS